MVIICHYRMWYNKLWIGNRVEQTTFNFKISTKIHNRILGEPLGADNDLLKWHLSHAKARQYCLIVLNCENTISLGILGNLY